MRTFSQNQLRRSVKMESLAAAVDSAMRSTNSGNRSQPMNVALKKAALTLLGCYRTGDAHDPQIYITAVIAVLSDYPQDIIDMVVDPRGGLPSKVKWLPTIAEIKAACEEIAAPRRRVVEWDERAKSQLAERKLLEAQGTRQTYEEFKAEMSARGMPIDGKKVMANFADEAVKKAAIDELKKRYGLTDEQWDAIPGSNAEDEYDRRMANYRK